LKIIVDTAEELAFEFLRELVGNDVRYEPDGNVPPDFLVNSTIAVEVRRLNQTVETAERQESLEIGAIPLLNTIRRVLEALGPSDDGNSWFLSYRFGRPVPAKREIEKELKSFLTSFRRDKVEAKTNAKLPCGLSIRLFPASANQGDEFVLGGYTDKDSGGWLLHELERNLKICLAEKSAKTAAYRHRYPEWWLVLVDHIGYGLGKMDQELLAARALINHDWSRVFLVDPRNHRNWFEYKAT
jgi:hypothetical protein